MHALMRARPFATLVSHGSSGLIATHLPTVLKAEGGHGVIEFHLARANPHGKELKGEALVCFVVLRRGRQPSDELEARLKDQVAQALGKPLRPKALHFVPDLPRTRNAKILRRVVRSVYLGQEPGDLSALESPAALDAIGAARAS